MDEPAFNEVYSKVLDTILTVMVANGVTEDEFNNILQNYSWHDTQKQQAQQQT